MILEFKTIRSDLEESFNREKQAEVQGEISLEFFREHDYISTTTVEMDDVIDYDVSIVYCNNQKHECVFARIGEETYTRNLLISGDDFKLILQQVRNMKIKSAENILTKAKNENYSEGI